MGSGLKDTNAKDGKKDRSKSEEQKLDDALDDSFPASDPPSMTDPAKHVGSGKKTGAGSTKPHHSGRE
jgi:hypothetical protein